MQKMAHRFDEEKSLLDYERKRLALLAAVHGGPLGLSIKKETGELSEEEERIFREATKFLWSRNAQFF
ncbi:MAG: hypothetical protein ACD_9C00255G0004 [uncultured bacterium]|nr:MAG: hypothetical protein ACD_9C00255G0004 [uncultured bacterium]